MGEQSCGKSFMLNHLVGTTFDVPATVCKRCTEGVWMSLVNTKECIYVALDFEGLRSFEGTSQEDMFLTLFNTVVSNLVLYNKNKYTINRDAKMFQNLQAGVKLFESDPKARLCIIIKDVPKADKDGIINELQLKLEKLIAEEGIDNFITKMYGDELNIMALPVFHDVAWFEGLSKIKMLLDKKETKYDNAKTFLQNTKVIMAKLKICDWSSLNENLIHIRVATLKRLLPIAVSYGIEQKDPVIIPLVNHDSEEPIYGPIDFLNDGNPIKLFPDINDDQVNHFCGKEHQCRELCEEDGICNVVTEPKKQEETYKGRVEGTVITYTKYIQLSEKLKCNKKIPPNEFEHTGKHTHNEDHYCDKKCQFCEYYCTLPYGHPHFHDTRHGINMTQTEFTGDEFVYAGVGDQKTFVLCNLFCKDLGRHRHIDYCQNDENCELSRDMQHINVKVSPNPDKPKDFISHKLFWERTGFKDPHTCQEQQEFTKCDHQCPDKKHKSRSSFCELQLFHAPISKPPNDYGYVSSDGHYFNCEKPNTPFHIIFVLDYSSSMTKQDIKPIQDFPIYNDLTKKHNNRIGAVYQAVYLFMNARRNSTMTDNISLILFNHKTIVPFEYQDLTNLKDLLNSMLQYEACGLINFDSAIQKAGVLIETHFDPTKVNVIIFLSDRECGTPTNQLNAICKQNKEKGSPLYLYTCDIVKRLETIEI
ncbi:unnamed protein product [Rhizophagus irregularis]|uniref:VWFA domain-containing protein n=1 Tax=Rhizophagus irregularis TaxID=588596 RepID=A0A915ZI56_9GLOM|nr:unnamed protein product [Rhizophagus irregularis]